MLYPCPYPWVRSSIGGSCNEVSSGVVFWLDKYPYCGVCILSIPAQHTFIHDRFRLRGVSRCEVCRRTILTPKHGITRAEVWHRRAQKTSISEDNISKILPTYCIPQFCTSYRVQWAGNDYILRSLYVKCCVATKQQDIHFRVPNIGCGVGDATVQLQY